MKAHAKKAVVVFVLWVLFTLCCLAAPIIAIGFHLYPKRGYMHRFVKTADRLVAALLGFSGKFTLSAEVATSERWKWLHDILNAVEPNHCEAEVFDEGAYCRIQDRQIGEK